MLKLSINLGTQSPKTLEGHMPSILGTSTSTFYMLGEVWCLSGPTHCFMSESIISLFLVCMQTFTSTQYHTQSLERIYPLTTPPDYHAPFSNTFKSPELHPTASYHRSSGRCRTLSIFGAMARVTWLFMCGCTLRSMRLQL